MTCSSGHAMILIQEADESGCCGQPVRALCPTCTAHTLTVGREIDHRSDPRHSPARSDAEEGSMVIQPKRPMTLTTETGTVIVKPHQVVRIPVAIAKKLLAKAPQIRRAR